MTIATYDIGDLVQVTSVFTNSAGTAIDPTTVSIQVKGGTDATVTTYVYGTDAALVKDSTGHYHCNISVTSSGQWHYRWVSTGTGQAAEEGYFNVRVKQTV